MVLVVPAAQSAELYRYQNEDGITVVDWAIPADYGVFKTATLNHSVTFPNFIGFRSPIYELFYPFLPVAKQCLLELRNSFFFPLCMSLT